MVIVGGVVVLSLTGQSVLIRPLYVSKLNTALQIALVALSLLLAGFGLSAPALVTTLVWLVAATTLGSGAAYVWVTVRRRCPMPPSARRRSSEAGSASQPRFRGRRRVVNVWRLWSGCWWWPGSRCSCSPPFWRHSSPPRASPTFLTPPRRN